MTDFERTLIAYGTSPEEARFLAWDQQRAWLANRENTKYGVRYEAEQIADAAPSTDDYEE